MTGFNVLRCIATLAVSVACAPAFAQNYPARPVRLIVPQPPGGGADIAARIVAYKLQENLKQQVVVDNRSGAGGIVGTELAAKSSADGYTLLLGVTGSLTISPSLQRKLPYRPLEDFDPVSLAISTPLLLTVHPSLRVASVAELVAVAKAKPVPLNYSTPGNGSLHHLATEWLRTRAGVELMHVPYKGSASFNAVVVGEVAFAFVSVVSSLPQVKAGRVRAIAISSKSRSTLLPEVPTIAESGVAGFEATNWFGVLAPRGTPQPVIVKLNALIVAGVNAPDTRERILKDGGEPVGSTPEAFAQLIRTEIARWREVVKLSGAKVD